jgi:hypothetical protein
MISKYGIHGKRLLIADGTEVRMGIKCTNVWKGEEIGEAIPLLL